MNTFVQSQRAPGSRVGLGGPLFVTTFSSLVLELALTRLFSTVFFYHYAFMVISIALLGLASGGILARLLPRDVDPVKHSRIMSLVCLGGALSLFPLLQVILTRNVWLVTSWAIFLQFAKVFVLCMIPFALTGFVVASTMVVGSRRIPSLYFFDLFGASCGCLVFVPLISLLGGPNAVLAAGFLWCVAAIYWAAGARSRVIFRSSVIGTIVVLGFIVANSRGSIFDVRYSRGKPRTNEVFAAWNSFSRISVDERQDGHFWIEIDGGAGTWIPNTDLEGEAGAQFREGLGKTGPSVALWLSERPRTLIIGPGGGYEIVRALAAGSPDITAVEINPIIANDLMRGRFEEYSRGIYSRPEVRVYVEDGRTFIQRTPERYDVILLTQVDTWASSASGAYGLTENYLYTVEAVEAYLSKLTDDGIVSIQRWEFEKPRETLRMVAVALEALDQRKVLQPRDHIVVLLEDLDSEAVQMGTVLVKKTPFTSDEIDALSQRAKGTSMKLAYAPGLPGEGLFSDLVLSTDRSLFFDNYEFNVEPVYDDRPFFFFMGRWADSFRDLFTVQNSGDSVGTGAQFLLVALLVLAVVAVAVFLWAPLLVFRRAFPVGRQIFPYLLFALAVGLGFIIVEIVLIQKFVVLLGQPVYSLTVVLFVLLLSSSLGSRATRAFPVEKLKQRAQAAIAGVVALVSLYVFVLPVLIASAQAAPVVLKIALVGGILFPLGFLMGMPFPSGLRLAARAPQHCIEWIWGINAAATVLGSVLAVFLSVTLGNTMSMMIGAVVYAGAACVLYAIRTSPSLSITKDVSTVECVPSPLQPLETVGDRA